MYKENIYKNKLFITIAFAIVFFVFMSHPFMKIPYDIWHHLSLIGAIFQTDKPFINFPDDGFSGRYFWHYCWAYVFKLLNIKYDFYLWAKIIHRTQFLISFFAILYSSYLLLQYVTNRDRFVKSNALLAALFSTILFFVGSGTFSGLYQQAWIAWYSVNYQITLPLYFLAMAMTITGIFSDKVVGKIFYLATTVLLLIVICLFHAMEFLYYLIFCAVFALFYGGDIMSFCLHHKYKSLLFTVLLAGLVGISLYIEGDRVVDLFTRHNFMSELISAGRQIVNSTNRFDSTASDLMLLSLLSSPIILIIAFYCHRLFDFKKLVILTVLSFFLFLIPTTTLLASIFSITGAGTVWRFFFAIPWFIFFSLIFYTIGFYGLYFVKIINIKVSNINIPTLLQSAFFAIFCILIFATKNLSYYNFFSIYDMLYENKMLSYSKEQQQVVEGYLRTKKNATNDLLYARSDIALISRSLGYYCFFDRLNNTPKSKFYELGLEKKYNLIEIPDLFPKSNDLQKSPFFNIEKKD